MKKYLRLTQLEVPKVNLQIALKLLKYLKARGHRVSRKQQLVDSALSIIGWTMSTLIEQKESIHKVLIERLGDAGKLIADSYLRTNKQNQGLH